MAEPEPISFVHPKRICLREIENDYYDSDEDFDFLSDDLDDSTDCSSKVTSDIDETEGGSNSSMDISDLNEPSIFIAKDGTRWTESLSAYTAHPGLSPKIVNHIPKVTERCDGCESLVGSVTLWYIAIL